MKELVQKKPRKQSRRDILAGLKAGYSYLRPYSRENGTILGIERLIPIGHGCTHVRHICELSEGAQEYQNEGIEEIDGLGQIIGPSSRWVRY